MNFESAAGNSVVGWTETSGALSMTRCPVSSERAEPVRAKAMLISSEIASRCRSVSSIALISLQRGLYYAEHVLRRERLVDERVCARLFDQRPRRGLYVCAGHDDARAGVHLAQLGQHFEPVHPLHHQVEEYKVGLLDEIKFERGHALLGLDHAVSGRLQDAPQGSTRQRGVIHDHDLFTHTASRIACAILSRGTLISLKPASTTEDGMP